MPQIQPVRVLPSPAESIWPARILASSRWPMTHARMPSTRPPKGINIPSTMLRMPRTRTAVPRPGGSSCPGTGTNPLGQGGEEGPEKAGEEGPQSASSPPTNPQQYKPRRGRQPRPASATGAARREGFLAGVARSRDARRPANQDDRIQCRVTDAAASCWMDWVSRSVRSRSFSIRLSNWRRFSCSFYPSLARPSPAKGDGLFGRGQALLNLRHCRSRWRSNPSGQMGCSNFLRKSASK